MVGQTQTFAVASDEALVSLISGARERLVVVAPALSKAVADALAHRLNDLENIAVTIILDSDPEVYRLGFGDTEALEVIREASTRQLFDLRQQPGVRIGVIVADGATMIYAPISKNIEAGSTSREHPNAIMLPETTSTSREHPNAIMLRDAAADRIAKAAGADNREDAQTPEVGNQALEPVGVQKMQENLKANPPKPFDITRKLNVFSSMVQYVEFSASNYRLTTKQIPLPPELISVDDDTLKKSITSRMRQGCSMLSSAARRWN